MQIGLGTTVMPCKQTFTQGLVQVSVGVHKHVHQRRFGCTRTSKRKIFLRHMLSTHGFLVCFVTPQHDTKAHDPISCGLGHYCTQQREGLFTVICLSTVVRICRLHRKLHSKLHYGTVEQPCSLNLARGRRYWFSRRLAYSCAAPSTYADVCSTLIAASFVCSYWVWVARPSTPPVQ